MDVATGPGFLLLELGKLLAAPRLIAQDGSEPMLAIAREEAAGAGLEVTTLACPAEAITLEDETVDVVTCKQLLHEAKDVDAALGEMARVLKPGGRAFVIDFDADGSRFKARLVKWFLTIRGGRKNAEGFWKSFNAGLRGVEVRERMLAAGFAAVEYHKAGFNYFMVASR